MPFDDDAADDVIGFRPPPHPDDRLWRHPSEVCAVEPASPMRARGRLWPWGVAAVGTAGVMLAGAGTLILGVRDHGGDQTQQASVTPLGSVPFPRVDGRSLTVRSSEGVTELDQIARLADHLAPSLVQIEAPPDAAAGGEGRRGDGSGVILNREGLTLTSADLVAGREHVVVTLHDGSEVTGELVGTDPRTDLAVLDLPGEHDPATVTDPRLVGAGERVMALGAVPEGRPATTVGPLSDRRRRLPGNGAPAVDGLLHVGVPAQQAAWGGPLVDQSGAVVGIVVATDESSTYATPSDVAAKVANDFAEHGEVRYGWLGIEGRDATTITTSTPPSVLEEQAAAPTTTIGGTQVRPDDGSDGSGGGGGQLTRSIRGVVVDTVDPTGPAAGQLQTGDVITRIGGRRIHDMDELTDEIRLLGPGDEVEVTVVRANPTTVEITLAPLSDDD